jgi:hypothetical protein
MPKQPIVTLLTDFGLSDSYVGQMRGAILSVLPDAHVADITHAIPPGDILAGSLALAESAPFFPDRTTHCVVVDPGVGTDRRILVARYAGQTVVCPDNGLLTFLDRELPLEQIVVVRNEEYYGTSNVSPTFHGRDIMAPVAARVAAGLPLGRLGPQPETFKMLELPEPQALAEGRVEGEIIHVDHFGNLVSNIPARLMAETLGHPHRRAVTCAGREVGPILATYGHVESGQPLALINSNGLLEVAVNGGSAAEALSAGVGAKVTVTQAD